MKIRTRCLLAWVVLLMPELALAHTPFKGIGSFYNGLLHPLIVPGHVLLLLAAGFWFGQQGLYRVRRPLQLSVGAVTLGLVSAAFSPGLPQGELWILGCAAGIGLLVAAAFRLPLALYAVVGIIAGFILGLDSAQDAYTGKERFLALLGSGIGIYFYSLYPLGLAEFCQHRPWTQVGVRVAGSWIAASALLVLALAAKTAA